MRVFQEITIGYIANSTTSFVGMSTMNIMKLRGLERMVGGAHLCRKPIICFNFFDVLLVFSAVSPREGGVN